MTQSPIPRVLSTFSDSAARALLMGGQACILYGGAEFSRDVDWVIEAEERNLERVRRTLSELPAEPVFFPPLTLEHLQRGHACHFRCTAPRDLRCRIDMMSVMRGVDPFPLLWDRREEIELPHVGSVPVLSLPDLVRAKKTQRDKDWPMIRRLIEADVDRHQDAPEPARLRFWLEECRTPELLIRLVELDAEETAAVAQRRPALKAAGSGDRDEVVRLLEAEERRERELDREYWRPLRAELESWRLKRGESG